MEKERLIKSKERVSQHGEVFTAEREVQAMLDLVENETKRIESRFLEPACGEGNFLARILERKLAIVKKQYSKYKSDYEKYSIIALTSIYGVELLEDNAELCRERLYHIWLKHYLKVMGKELREDSLLSAKYIINKNILCGDALTMLQKNGNPIIFAQWDLILGDLVKRKDYRLDILMDNEEENSEDHYQIDIFSDYDSEWENKEGKLVKLPKAVQNYDPVVYWRLHESE